MLQLTREIPKQPQSPDYSAPGYNWVPYWHFKEDTNTGSLCIHLRPAALPCHELCCPRCDCNDSLYQHPLPNEAAMVGPSHGICKGGDAPGIYISHQDRGHKTSFSFLSFSFFFFKDLTFRRKFMGNPNNNRLPPSV